MFSDRLVGYRECISRYQHDEVFGFFRGGQLVAVAGPAEGIAQVVELGAVAAGVEPVGLGGRRRQALARVRPAAAGFAASFGGSIASTSCRNAEVGSGGANT